MMKTFSRGSRNYQPQTATFDIPPGAQRRFIGVSIVLTRESWAAGVDYTLSDGSVAPNTAVAARFLRTVDNGVTWEEIGAGTFPGGDLYLKGVLVPTSKLVFSFVDGNGNPVSKPGDTRVELKNLVALRTAITATMLEEGDTV